MSAVRRYVIAFAILGTFTLFIAAVALMMISSTLSSDDTAAADEHSQLGIALMRQHLYHAAIDEFEAAIRNSPSTLDPWVGLAAIYIRLGNGPKALDEARKAVNLAENSPDVQLVFGRAHWLSRNLSDAETAALRADELDPSNEQAAELLLHIYFDRKD